MLSLPPGTGARRDRAEGPQASGGSITWDTGGSGYQPVGPLRVLLTQLRWEMKHLQDQIDEVDSVVLRTSGQNEACQRLKAIRHRPSDGHRDRLGNWQRSGIQEGAGLCRLVRLGSIAILHRREAKAVGHQQARELLFAKTLVHGARAVLQTKDKQSSGLRTWLTQLTSRAHSNVVAISLVSFEPSSTRLEIMIRRQPLAPPSLQRTAHAPARRFR
jgi:hypothetical protein